VVPAPFVVAESGAAIELPEETAASWEVVRERQYGVAVVTFFRRIAP
jgi:16S rRNA G966 N2-methylase RsmD